MIAQRLSRSEFIDELLSDPNSDYSHESADMLYDHYWDLAQETGETFYLDRVAIRCEWSEWTEDELRGYYGIGYDEDVCNALIDGGHANYAMRVNMGSLRPARYLVSTLW